MSLLSSQYVSKRKKTLVLRIFVQMLVFLFEYDEARQLITRGFTILIILKTGWVFEPNLPCDGFSPLSTLEWEPIFVIQGFWGYRAVLHSANASSLISFLDLLRLCLYVRSFEELGFNRSDLVPAHSTIPQLSFKPCKG